MTLAALKTKANGKLQEFWDVLVVKQEAYFQKHGNYFQLRTSPELPVVDGADSDFTVIVPSDFTVRSVDIDMSSFTSKIPFQIEVQPWGNYLVQGYRAIVVVELLDGRRFKRSRTLTDTRRKKQDYDYTGEMPVKVGEKYWDGPAPTIETTPWEEVIPD